MFNRKTLLPYLSLNSPNMNKLSSNLSILHTCSRIVRTVRSTRGIFSSNSVLNNKNDDGDQIKDNAEAEKTDPESKKKETEKKLQDLLIMMSKITTEPMPNVKIPKPRELGKAQYEKRKAEIQKEKEEDEQQKLEYQLEKAAKNVAKSVGDDPKKTEEELLELYLYGKTTEQKVNAERKQKVELGDLINTMKIEKDSEPSRADQLRSYYASRPDKNRIGLKETSSISGESVDIFGEEPLGIFDPKTEKSETPVIELTTWNYLEERDLRLLVTHPPTNIFDQLIQWTNEGKIWRFPIDNEQDWSEEADMDFTEHVFLEKHIEPWCPKDGPIRHFMELVCVGLSKNPYLTVAEKRAHISFYEHYFRSKNALLVELGIPEIPEKLKQVAVE